MNSKTYKFAKRYFFHYSDLINLYSKINFDNRLLKGFPNLNENCSSPKINEEIDSLKNEEINFEGKLQKYTSILEEINLKNYENSPNILSTPMINLNLLNRDNMGTPIFQFVIPVVKKAEQTSKIIENKFPMIKLQKIQRDRQSIK